MRTARPFARLRLGTQLLLCTLALCAAALHRAVGARAGPSLRAAPAGRGAGAHDAAGGLPRHALRRRAGRRAADRVHLRRPRPALGRRVPLLPELATRRPQTGHDRIVIFEDTDGDGHFDKRTVFADNLANLSGIELGFGGVWLCSHAEPAVHPGRHDGERQARRPAAGGARRLERQGRQHNVFNRLTWGPDGWLYGLQRHPVQLARRQARHARRPSASPSTAASGATTRRAQIFEVVAHGTTNPWGLDFDDYGQMFITNCVIEHLWHVVPGAHYQRMYGQDLNPHVYEPDASLRRPHPLGRRRLDRRRAAARTHTATPAAATPTSARMVYLGDNWPDDYRNAIFMCNLHGNRVNHDLLEQHGSGYVAHHGKDFLLANDPWFRGIDLHYGPDGGVYVSDWTDTGECHNYDVVDRTNGRIYKVTYGKPDAALRSVDLAPRCRRGAGRAATAQERLVRPPRPAAAAGAGRGGQARRRHAARRCSKMLAGQPRRDAASCARCGACTSPAASTSRLTRELLASPEPYLRGWAIQLALEGGQAAPPLAAKLAELAKTDPSPVVRLFLASGLQRLPVEQRWPIATAPARPRRGRGGQGPAADGLVRRRRRWRRPTRPGRPR